jgi:hypothetical protein
MSPSASIIPTRAHSGSARERHGAAGVLAQYIQDLAQLASREVSADA